MLASGAVQSNFVKVDGDQQAGCHPRLSTFLLDIKNRPGQAQLRSGSSKASIPAKDLLVDSCNAWQTLLSNHDASRIVLIRDWG